MKPEVFRTIQAQLGLSDAALARELGLGAHGARNVRRWKAGKVEIPEDVAQKILRLFEAG